MIYLLISGVILIIINTTNNIRFLYNSLEKKFPNIKYKITKR